MISFDNTEIAFKHQSNKDLRRAKFLFSVIASPVLVKIGKSVTRFALKIGLPIKGIIKKTIFKQFCGGESIEECTPTIDKMWKHRVGTILDYSIEGKTSVADFESTTQEIIATIEKGKTNPSAIPFAVFKISGICRFEILEKANHSEKELSEKELSEFLDCKSRVLRICQAGFDNDISVFIDAEETWIQDVIDRICHEMIQKFNTTRALIFNTVQIYRHDRLAFLKKAVRWSKEQNVYYGVKLVRGAYMEKERKRAQEKGYSSPIQLNKENCDKDYNESLLFLIQEINHVAFCAGSHNEDSASILVDMMEKARLKNNDNRIYFAQLLGMSDHISYTLANAGFNVAKYVPYGPVSEVIPYLFRRADENTSVKGQTGRELRLISTEKKRRKK